MYISVQGQILIELLERIVKAQLSLESQLLPNLMSNNESTQESDSPANDLSDFEGQSTSDLPIKMSHPFIEPHQAEAKVSKEQLIIIENMLR